MNVEVRGGTADAGVGVSHALSPPRALALSVCPPARSFVRESQALMKKFPHAKVVHTEHVSAETWFSEGACRGICAALVRNSVIE